MDLQFDNDSFLVSVGHDVIIKIVKNLASIYAENPGDLYSILAENTKVLCILVENPNGEEGIKEDFAVGGRYRVLDLENLGDIVNDSVMSSLLKRYAMVIETSKDPDNDFELDGPVIYFAILDTKIDDLFAKVEDEDSDGTTGVILEQVIVSGKEDLAQLVSDSLSSLVSEKMEDYLKNIYANNVKS